MSSGGHYSEDFAELSGDFTPEQLANLRVYWDGRDLTPVSGTAVAADDWVARGGPEAYTLPRTTALLSSYNGFRGATGRFQKTTYTHADSPSGDWVYFYVLKVPPLTGSSGYQGISAYLGKPLPFFFDNLALKSARGTIGASFESLRTLVSDCSSWSGQLLSIVVRHTSARIDAFWEIGGTPGSATYVGSSTNAKPDGLSVGAFADSGGEINAPTFSVGIVAGCTDAECQKLATRGTAIWSGAI